MRVLLIVNEFPPQQLRGTAMATASLAQALTQRGWEVCVIVARSDGNPPEEMVGQVRVHRLSIRPLPFTGTVQRLLRILLLARKIRPDLVQGQAASCGLFAVIVGRLLSIPSITYIQGMDFHEAGPLRRRLEVGPAIRHATRTLAVSDLFATAIRPYATGPVQSLPHGYQPDPVLPEIEEAARLRLRKTGPNLLFVGHLEPDKGESYLLHAVGMLANDWPGLTLHMVGDGPLRSELETLASRLGIASLVMFHGWLPHATVLALMRHVDLFVLSSVMEPFGIVVVEALNEGCPVVATTACGSAMAVEQGRSGFVVQPADSQALAEAMRRILADPALKESLRLGAKGAGAKYRWDRIVKRFEQVYREVLETR